MAIIYPIYLHGPAFPGGSVRIFAEPFARAFEFLPLGEPDPVPPLVYHLRTTALTWADSVHGVCWMNNHSQLLRTLRELRRMGRIEAVDAAAVQALRSMAAALDADPSNAALWRQYREALRELTAVDDDGPANVGDLFAEVGDPQAS